MANPSIASESLSQLLTAMRSLAVIPVATCVLRTDLLQLRQERDEAIRAFAARVRGKAETCTFAAQCECGKSVNYTGNAIRDVLLNSLADSDIRREVLGTKDIITKPINDIVALVEGKEMPRNALPSSTLSAVSTFQNQRKTAPVKAPPQAERNKEAICLDCKTTFKIFIKGARGWNTQPHQVCIYCYRSRRRRQHKKRSPQVPSTNIQALEADPISQVAAFQTSGAGSHHKRRRRHRNSSLTTHGTINKPLPPSLSHHIFSKGEWKRARLREHPKVAITISLDKLTQGNSGNSHQSSDIHADVSAIADTGAQSDLWSFADFLASGFTRADLHPIHLSLSAANRSPISIEGAFFAKLATRSPTGEESSCRSMVYVSSSVQDMYLSYESLLNLDLLSSDFPSTDHGASPCDRCH